MIYYVLPIIWLATTAVLATVIYQTAFRLIPICIANRAIAEPRKRAGAANVLILRPTNDAGNCRIPMAIPDSLMSLCVYDVTEYPVRIRATIPPHSYWSLSCYGRNTDNFFVVNDKQIRKEAGNQVSLVLTNPRHDYSGAAHEIVVSAPSNVGMVLIRMMVSDPLNEEAFASVASIQEQAYAEEIRGDLSVENGMSADSRYRVDFCGPTDERYVRIFHSSQEIAEHILDKYDVRIASDQLKQNESIELTQEVSMIFKGSV